MSPFSFLKTEKLKELLHNAVFQLSARDLKSMAGLVPGQGAGKFEFPEDELKKVMRFPEGINSETISTIFNIGIRQICRQMIKSASVLSDEILVQACKTIVEELQASKGKHLFFFFVPSIILAVDESIEIGNAILRKASVADAELLEGRANVQIEWVDHKGPLDKSDFLKRYLGSTLVEFRFPGYHFKDELSAPADEAWKGFRRIAAFFLACKELLQIPEVYANLGPDFAVWPQETFMVGKSGGSPLVPIYSHGSQFSINGLEFAIDAQVLEQLEKFCHLQAFNQLCRSQDELRDKIYRSLDWFLKGYSEEDPTDRLVCFFISLESLMATGSDALNSQTDDLAENIALLIHQKGSARIDEKNYFKKKVYPLRNRVMHHGHTFEAKDAPISERLIVYITHGLIEILKHLDEIMKDGGPRNFFERIKMGAVL